MFTLNNNTKDRLVIQCMSIKKKKIVLFHKNTELKLIFSHTEINLKIIKIFKISQQIICCYLLQLKIYSTLNKNQVRIAEDKIA